MKVINITKTILAAMGATFFCACDQVDSDERYIELPPAEARRVVLLEEYTGQKCPNCPVAHQAIDALHEIFADTLITVSIHCGGDAFSYNGAQFPFGLASDLTQALGDEAGVYALPCGVVNRNSGILSYAEWQSAIRKAKSQPSCIELSATAAVKGENIDVDVEINPTDNIKGRLLVWVVESKIVAPQQNGSKFVVEYEHNHVLRASANGQHGDEFTLVTREPQTASYSIKINEKWNKENLSIVVFMYNNKEGVLQAVAAHL